MWGVRLCYGVWRCQALYVWRFGVSGGVRLWMSGGVRLCLGCLVVILETRAVSGRLQVPTFGPNCPS